MGKGGARVTFHLPLYLEGVRTLAHARITITSDQVQVQVPGGLIQFEKERFLRALCTNCWSQYVEFHEHLTEQVLTWDFFTAMKQHGVLGRRIIRKEAA